MLIEHVDPARKDFQGYRPSAIMHSVSPQNEGRLEDADGLGHASYAASGEHVEVSLSIHEDVITAARFRAQGCPALVAAGSILTQIISDNPLYVAVGLTPDDLDYALGRLPELRRYTTTLVITALHRAVLTYYARTQPISVDNPQPRLAI